MIDGAPRTGAKSCIAYTRLLLQADTQRIVARSLPVCLQVDENQTQIHEVKISVPRKSSGLIVSISPRPIDRIRRCIGDINEEKSCPRKHPLIHTSLFVKI